MSSSSFPTAFERAGGAKHFSGCPALIAPFHLVFDADSVLFSILTDDRVTNVSIPIMHLLPVNYFTSGTEYLLSFEQVIPACYNHTVTFSKCSLKHSFSDEYLYRELISSET